MKKLSLLVVLFSFLFVACADKKPKAEKVEVTTEMEIQEGDTMVVDSLATKLEEAKDDIEEAAKEVDQLLEEL
jgi:thiamine biosynthesis lipoprotein ApbE